MLHLENRDPERTDTIVPKYELITTHTARLTFATLSLEKTVRTELLMLINGHKNMRTMNRYINLTDNVVSFPKIRNIRK